MSTDAVYYMYGIVLYRTGNIYDISDFFSRVRACLCVCSLTPSGSIARAMLSRVGCCPKKCVQTKNSRDICGRDRLNTSKCFTFDQSYFLSKIKLCYVVDQSILYLTSTFYILLVDQNVRSIILDQSGIVC